MIGSGTVSDGRTTGEVVVGGGGGEEEGEGGGSVSDDMALTKTTVSIVQSMDPAKGGVCA